MHRQTRMLGTGGSMQCRQARLDERSWGMSQCGRRVHWMHDAGFPRQIYVLHGSATRVVTLLACGSNIWQGHSGPAKVYAVCHEQGTRLAQARRTLNNRTSAYSV